MTRQTKKGSFHVALQCEAGKALGFISAWRKHCTCPLHYM